MPMRTPHPSPLPARGEGGERSERVRGGDRPRNLRDAVLSEISFHSVLRHSPWSREAAVGLTPSQRSGGWPDAPPAKRRPACRLAKRSDVAANKAKSAPEVRH